MSLSIFGVQSLSLASHKSISWLSTPGPLGGSKGVQGGAFQSLSHSPSERENASLAAPC